MTDGKHSKPAVDSPWIRTLRYCLFIWPALFSFAGILLLLPLVGISGPEVLALLARLYIVGLLLLVVLAVVIPVLLYLDGTEVRAAPAEWSPSLVLYAVVGFFFSYLALIDYLYKRFRYTVMPDEHPRWVYGVAFATVLSVGAASSFVLVWPLTFGLSLLAMGILPICLYMDAAHVAAADGEWSPNPTTYFSGAFFGTVLVVVPPLLAGYYLLKRHRHHRTP